MDEIIKNFYFNGIEYHVDNFGNIYNSKGLLLKQRLNEDGYCYITLGRKEKRSSVSVHRIVAKSFVENKDNKEEVNHIDFDRTNNHYKNLEWVTHQENIQYTVDAGRMDYQNRNTFGENNYNYGNRKLSKIYSENLEYAKEKQSRPGLMNGRCTPIKIIGNGVEKEFDYIMDCSRFLIENNFSKAILPETVNSSISMAMKNGSKYLGFNFYKI